jgi:hypothetical protein
MMSVCEPDSNAAIFVFIRVEDGAHRWETLTAAGSSECRTTLPLHSMLATKIRGYKTLTAGTAGCAFPEQ